jgi:hypothetical protein
MAAGESRRILIVFIIEIRVPEMPVDKPPTDVSVYPSIQP